MERLLQRILPSLKDHLTDDRIASLFCHELPFAERIIAKQHLANCWTCRFRQEDLVGRRADRVMDVYRKAIEGEVLSLPATPRSEFLRQLEVHIQNESPRRWCVLRLPHLPLPELSSMNPILVTCMILGLATVFSFFSWWQERLPNITSSALLMRAERWDISGPTTSSGVVFQTVRITTQKQTFERSIYRDLQRKRQLRPVRLTEKDDQLRKALMQAGLNWDEPISAFGYQGWHDRQPVRVDRIVRAGKHLLTLTTTVPNGFVAEQSLTVRDTDFHPVRRTVAFRGTEPVEIAEVDFKILPWSAVDVSLFEPVDRDLRTAVTNPARVIPFPRMPETLAESQLDETELGARLILNQLHADTGEQIEIHRTMWEIEVTGLVETEERKRILQTQLRNIPHLTVSIQSVADLKSRPDTNDAAMTIETASMSDQSSPLEIHLLARGHSVTAINVFEQRLFLDALTISQESKAISDLQSRFISGTQNTIVASATLSELIYSHHERLNIALKQERELLAEILGVSSEGKESAKQTSTLADAAARNLTLCKELTQTNSPATRTAETIIGEISISVEDLNVHMNEAYGMLQGGSTPSGRK